MQTRLFIFRAFIVRTRKFHTGTAFPLTYLIKLSSAFLRLISNKNWRYVDTHLFLVRSDSRGGFLATIQYSAFVRISADKDSRNQLYELSQARIGAQYPNLCVSCLRPTPLLSY